MTASPMSVYPGGFANGVSVRGLPIAQTHPGRAFWVSNNTTGLLAGQRGGSDGNKGTFDSPFSTLSYAVTQCVANRGDVIYIKPGHAESVIAAGTIALSIAGVAIVGLGVGASRPTFTYTTANTASITVSAANVSIQNCIFTSNFLSVAAAFVLTTAKWFTVQGCLFTDTSSILNFLNCIKSTGAANTIDGLSVTDSQWFGQASTSTNSMVLSADAVNMLTFCRNRICLARTVDTCPGITVTTGIVLNADIGENVINSQQTATTGGSLIKVTGTTSSGSVYRNFVGTLTAAGDVLFTTTVGLWAFENRVAGAIGATGFVIPAADS